jgi:hypothetical protein
MKLSIPAAGLTAGLLGAASMLVVGTINWAMPAYGADFLRMMSSIYPGFHDSRTWLSVVIGTLYGFADGAIAGLVFAWIYDRIAGSERAVDHTA